MPLEKKPQDYTTVITNRGLFKYTVLPFGISSAGASFTRMMRKLLDKTKNLDSYLDDVLCHTNTWNEHLISLREFFSKVREANLKLKPSKCEIGGNKIEFL